MQKTGIIRNLEPKGGYESRNGYINTFWIGIETDAGMIKGEIGTKSEQYPKNIGEQITVDITEDPQYGTKLKAVNPKYGGGGGGSRPPQTKEDVEGKCKCQVICAAIASGQLSCTSLSDVQSYADYMMGKKAKGGEPNPDWVGEDPEPIDNGSEIPF